MVEDNVETVVTRFFEEILNPDVLDAFSMAQIFDDMTLFERIASLIAREFVTGLAGLDFAGIIDGKQVLPELYGLNPEAIHTVSPIEDFDFLFKKKVIDSSLKESV